MKRLRRIAVLGAAAALAAGAITVVTSAPAAAHGAAMAPGSRTFLCYKDGKSPTGQIIPQNPACAAAVAQSGANTLYNWFSVLRSDAGGRTTGFVPDGQLCSGGNSSFSGFNLARNDWPLTHLTAGGNFSFKYSNWAHHPGTFYFYVTKDSWSPTRALAWSDLEEPFLTVTNPPQSGAVGSEEGHYYFSGRLPTGKSGKHIIYSRWVRSDSQENFFGCSDVVFDGGNGEVTGIGSGANPGNPPTTPPGNPPTTPPGGSAGCAAAYRLTGNWSGGFQAEVTVTNSGTSALSGWTTQWTWANGQTIGSLWNASFTQSGSSVTVRSSGHNGNLAPGASATFGFTGSATGTNAVPALTCTSS
ncbi:lytic polysaccharide monooxygenase auxiliary activity family 9 protein [Plantactinospora sp. CA-290183]|uniref:lytic polysaccharide monooxygenase auxiliary activity family 9 protein n=1 Tax=Plantactinospora sp. CA-290183 TaxID=3240006 RepID=UPI003D8A0266